MTRRSPFLHGLGLWIVLFGLWILLSGFFDPLLLTLGFVFSIVAVLIAIRLDVVDHEAMPLQLSLRYILYLFWLGGEIFKSNLEVARIVLRPRLVVHPKLVRTRPLQKTDVGKVIYANSITLTPGTVSIEFDDNGIIVHAVSEDAARSLLNDEMNRRIAAIETR